MSKCVARRGAVTPTLTPAAQGRELRKLPPLSALLRTGEGGVGGPATKPVPRRNAVTPTLTLPRYAREGTGAPLPCPRFLRAEEGGVGARCLRPDVTEHTLYF